MVYGIYFVGLVAEDGILSPVGSETRISREPGECLLSLLHLTTWFLLMFDLRIFPRCHSGSLPRNGHMGPPTRAVFEV